MAPKRKRQRREKGTGSIVALEGGKFRAELEINGRIVSRTAPDRQAAQAKLEELLELKRKQIDVGSGAQSMRAWLHTWLAIKARQVKASTIGGYRAQIQSYITPKIGDVRLDGVKAHHIQALLDHIVDDTRTAYQDSPGAASRRTGARTAQLVANCLNQAFELAAARKLILDNPMRGVVLPKARRARVTPPSIAQVHALLHKAHDAPHAALWHIYALLGLRLGEGIGLRWGDLDWQAGTIAVRQQVQKIAGVKGLQTNEPKNEAGMRVLPVPAVIADMLRALQSDQRLRRIKRADTWQDNDLIFCTRDGLALAPRFVEKHWYLLRDASGMTPDSTLHWLRHSVSTLLDEAGASEALKQDILGHEAKTVTNRYTHGRIDAMRRVLETVAERVLSKVA